MSFIQTSVAFHYILTPLLGGETRPIIILSEVILSIGCNLLAGLASCIKEVDTSTLGEVLVSFSTLYLYTTTKKYRSLVGLRFGLVVLKSWSYFFLFSFTWRKIKKTRANNSTTMQAITT